MGEGFDGSKLNAHQRAVIDWLARQPARVFDFSEVAAGLGLGPNVDVEAIVMTLRDPRLGIFLSGIGPDGAPLRERKAYLPERAPVRAEYPKLKHPPAAQQKERPPPPPAKKTASEHEMEARRKREAADTEQRQREKAARLETDRRVAEKAKRERAERELRAKQYDDAVAVALTLVEDKSKSKNPNKEQNDAG